MIATSKLLSCVSSQDNTVSDKLIAEKIKRTKDAASFICFQVNFLFKPRTLAGNFSHVLAFLLQDSSMANPQQEAEWLKYSHFWPDPGDQDHHG